MNYLTFLFLLLQVGISAQDLKPPADRGVYMQEGDKWVGIPKASAESKTKGLGLFIETGGYTNLGTDGILTGTKSATRTKTSRPTFYVRETGNPKNVALIQLVKKGGRRTFHTSSADKTTENKLGFKKTVLRKTAVTEHPDGTYSIIPEQDLKPGEYLLVLGDAETSFDFGIDLKK